MYVHKLKKSENSTVNGVCPNRNTSSGDCKDLVRSSNVRSCTWVSDVCRSSYLKCSSIITVNDAILGKCITSSTTKFYCKISIKFKITEYDCTTVTIYTKYSVGVSCIFNKGPSTVTISTTSAIVTEETKLGRTTTIVVNLYTAIESVICGTSSCDGCSRTDICSNSSI